jgi:tetratricopeptide (TPR) repeat protein
VSETKRVERVRSSAESWHLRDERDLLARSLEDAALEHDAGDLSDEDYELLRTRDERRLAEVDAALGRVLGRDDPSATTAWRLDGAPSGRRPARRRGKGTVPRSGRFGKLGRVRWRRRWWMAVVGVAAVVAAATLLVIAMSGPRLPGEDATGSISLNNAQQIAQQLSQAKTLVAHRRTTEALELYGAVLAEDPRQPVALAEWGWLDWQAGTRAKQQTVAAQGASALEEAVKVDPHLYAAQYYLGAVLFEEGARQEALSHLKRFLADKPTRTWLHAAAPELRAVYAAAHEPLPAAVPGG